MNCSKHKRILVICGLTASGKTSLALKIARLSSPASIISVDSRQAYQGLPILSGQDIPQDFHRSKNSQVRYRRQAGVCFSACRPADKQVGRSSSVVRPINIWGVDQVPPNNPLNISNFTKFIWQVIKLERSNNRSIIIVGGAGLYLKAILEPLSDIHLGFNRLRRKTLAKLPLDDLQKKLIKLNNSKFARLNRSDKNNPRRLIRAIEISLSSKLSPPDYFNQQKKSIFLVVGLRENMIGLKKKIKQRIIKQIRSGAIDEAISLTKKYPDRTLPIFSSLGLTPILSYQDKSISKDDLINLWLQNDLAYAKRQLTWFKKQSSIIWYDKNRREGLAKKLASWLKD